ncbi:hypothetical protein GFS24_11450 [Chitinophaga sp. SYP-B3965]|uniref:hypothetical protein n=1 Tax=Chitinophaga sp. SYP-B3965 TaxID=2663120 RepID=UPI0012997CF1|nr:hypothetical protein [Chitinophaga sp. SYP-B3965]MRG45735.1 hypothetical protein [Chitinophaga sp. SYP-B3965]
MKKISICLVFTILFFTSVKGQEGVPNVLTADSLSSGNYKDAFKSFFQLAFDRFTSDHKDIQFTSNPFAIMARSNPKLLIDSSYKRYKALRNLNFSFSARLDSNYKFNGFSSGITYAIVNRRDETVSDFFASDFRRINQNYEILQQQLVAFASASGDVELIIKYNQQISDFFKGKAGSNSLDAPLQARLRKMADSLSMAYLTKELNNGTDVNAGKLMQSIYDSVRSSFQNRLLITTGVMDTTYNNQFMFSNIVLFANLVKGVVKPNKVCGLELNVKASYQFVDDTLYAGRDLKRKAFHFEPGLNLVIKEKKSQYAWAEFKVSGEYTHVSNPYVGEKKDQTTINSVLRIRIYQDIWVPLEIKYDPESGNFLGFLNVRANFKGLKGLMAKN